jgi:hypothetical protein
MELDPEDSILKTQDSFVLPCRDGQLQQISNFKKVKEVKNEHAIM